MEAQINADLSERAEEAIELDQIPQEKGENRTEHNHLVRQNVSSDPLLNCSSYSTNSQTVENDSTCNHDQVADSKLEDEEKQRLAKKSRRVTFPDGKVVTGCMDPPDPWAAAASCSTEELVTAYRWSCEKHGIRPIPKLLSQLKAIVNFTERNETLTLKGEKLDIRACETLEEVLRRVRFRTLELENTHLDEEGSVAIFDMLEYYESCTHLNVSHNKNLGLRGWQACSKMLKKTPCLEQLDLRMCALSEQVMPMLGRALRMGSQLSVIHLENAILSGRPLMILVTAIKMNEILKCLYLAGNKLMPMDGIQLGNMLKYNQHLELLDVRNNHLQGIQIYGGTWGGFYMVAILTAVKDGVNLGAIPGDVGTSHLCDGLYEQNQEQGLKTLVLWDNHVTYQAMPALARAMYASKALETLNLGHNSLTNEGVHRLKDGLLQNKSLLRIGLQACKISCEGAVALAEFIADSPRLLRIDLRENDIKTGGLMALSLSLRVNSSLTRMDLDRDPKRESGVRDYEEQQRRLHQDISGFMQRNREGTRLKEEEAARLAAEAEKPVDALQSDTSLPSINPPLVVSPGAGPEAETEEEEEKLRKTDFNLDLPPDSRTMELESPGFVRQADMAHPKPPSSLELATETAPPAVTQELPIEFPPSPMAPQPKAKVLLASTPESGAAAVLSSPSQSPSAHRKFVISRVHESLEEEEAGDKPMHSATVANQAPSVINSSDCFPTKDTTSLLPSGDKQLNHMADKVTRHDGDGHKTDTNTDSAPQTGTSVQDSIEQSLNEAQQGSDSPMSPPCVNPEDTEESSSNKQADLANSNYLDHEGNGNEDACTFTDSVSEENVKNTLHNSTEDCTLDNDEFSQQVSINASQGEDSVENATTGQGSPPVPDEHGDSSDPAQASPESCQENKTAPDFHSSLSLNGVKVELASVLDSLDGGQALLDKTAPSSESVQEETAAKKIDIPESVHLVEGMEQA